MNMANEYSISSADLWFYCDSNGVRTYNHLVPKRTLNHLAKLAINVLALMSL